MNIFGLYSLSYGKFFFDPLYMLLVVWPMLGIARLAALFGPSGSMEVAEQAQGGVLATLRLPA